MAIPDMLYMSGHCGWPAGSSSGFGPSSRWGRATARSAHPHRHRGPVYGSRDGGRMTQAWNPDLGDDRPSRESTVGRAGAKKAYAAPRLVEYGSVAKLTQNGAGSVADQKFGMR